MSKKTNERKKRINSLVLLIAFTAILLIASTYAWFSTQKNVSINNLEGRVQVAEGLQISLDAENWSQEINLGAPTVSDSLTSINEDWTAYDTGIGSGTTAAPTSKAYYSRNYRPRMLKADGTGVESNVANAETGYMMPVSTDGAVSSSTIIPFHIGTYSGVTLKDMGLTSETLSTGEVNLDKHLDYYAFDIYLMNTTKTKVKSGDTDPNFVGDQQIDVLQLGFNSTVEELKRAVGAEDYGLQNGVRVAFALYGDTEETNASKDEIIDKTFDSTIDSVAIWEPNYDKHSDYVMKQDKHLRGLTGGVNSTALNTYAVKSSATATSIANVYDTTDASLNETKFVVQTSGNMIAKNLNVSDGTAADSTKPLGIVNGEKGIIGSETGTVNLKKMSDGSNFALKSNTISKVRVYVWLEGQDPDCINWASHSDGINVNINLCKDASTKFVGEDSTHAHVNEGFTIE